MIYSLQIIVSLVLDFIFGDPRWYPHPVRGIGWFVEMSEVIYRNTITNTLVAGFLTAITVISATIFIVSLPLLGAAQAGIVPESVVAVIFLYMAVSTKDLLVHSNSVYRSLVDGEEIHESRKKIGMIVGRDTRELNRGQIAKACVETVAENMVDGSTAPLFYAVLGSFLSPLVPLSPVGCSAVAVFAYKAVNTMDSMLGYKNEKYLYFGRFAAKLDDFVNFVPARISGFCLIAAAFVLRLDWRQSLVVYLRDHDKHSSPNAAHPEAAVAGALGLRLGGPSKYFGEIVDKPYIGSGAESAESHHIKEANRLVVTGFIIFVGLLLLFRYGISSLIS